MALTKKQKKNLDMAMGSKKAADRLVAKMNANAALSKKEKKELDIALADKKASKNASDKIPLTGSAVSSRTKKVLDEAMASKKDGTALKAEIEK